MSNLQEGNPNFVLLIQQEMDIITAMRRGQPLTPARPKVLFPTLIVPSRDALLGNMTQTSAASTLSSSSASLISFSKQNTIAINPTGGGKTIIWLLFEIIARRGNHLQLLPPPFVVIIAPHKATIE